MGLQHQLHVITDGSRSEADIVAAATRLSGVGANFLQLRYKSAPALDLYQLASRLREVLASSDMGLLINDRLDVALAALADGCHLAGRSLPVAAARRVIGSDALLGRSVHTVEDAVAAANEGAHYVTYGHVFPSKSKPGLTPRGLEALAEVVESVHIPVLAIGGITVSNIHAVLQTGCAGVAVIGAVMDQPDPGRATRELREAMDRYPKEPIRPLTHSLRPREAR